MTWAAAARALDFPTPTPRLILVLANAGDHLTAGLRGGLLGRVGALLDRHVHHRSAAVSVCLLLVLLLVFRASAAVVCVVRVAPPGLVEIVGVSARCCHSPPCGAGIDVLPAASARPKFGLLILHLIPASLLCLSLIQSNRLVTVARVASIRFTTASYARLVALANILK